MNMWESTVTLRTFFLWGVAVTTGFVAASVLLWATPCALLAAQALLDKVTR